MNTALEVVKFNDDFLEVVKISAKDAIDKIDGVYYVSVRKVCENLDLHLNTQFKKLKSDLTYKAEYVEVETAGGAQSVFCIPLDKLNGWLFSINPNKVKPEVKQKLIAYKEECFNVLFHHFIDKAAKQALPKQPDPYIYQLERENIELKRTINRLTRNADDNQPLKRIITQELDEMAYQLTTQFTQMLQSDIKMMKEAIETSVVMMHKKITHKERQQKLPI